VDEVDQLATLLVGQTCSISRYQLRAWIRAGWHEADGGAAAAGVR
jgi:hypothetical protein